ncbi:DNA-processing protein DprA [Spiribacter vilamensis]|uniref:DNA protecting protein DprA n=1 Tax=Spiribacter vilamensis TaxID=531306 RepID=A0A4V2GJ99_9GAMM|nr:DNA-processing protein DprA [Spiribacter vilamensis]RZU99475.1 DNA protecting protein DprA [Spiribacter vilamensis]TVO61552.1 DNA-protecting protein DprA [Spiribacter vilamensis]
MTDTPLESWLCMVRLKGIGALTGNRILEAYGDPASYLDATEADRAARGLPRVAVTAPRGRAAVEDGVAADQRWAEAADCHIITLNDPRYPPPLARIADPPPVLFLRGDAEALLAPQIAIVGARHASENGRRTAEEFAAHLSAAGLTITSGLALGIDTAAHEGALAVNGPTVAVMATGPDRVYPRENRGLAHAIGHCGAIVTEMPVGTPVTRGLFPRRNRLIAALSVGTVVIEAGRNSGALGTAYRAIEADREAMAVPGSIHNPVVKGCHALIRAGARLVESADQVIEEIARAVEDFTPRVPASNNEDNTETGHPASDWTALDPQEIAVLEAMGHDPVAFDTLLRRASLTPDILSSILLKLELSGDIAPCSGGYYMRTSNRAGG